VVLRRVSILVFLDYFATYKSNYAHFRYFEVSILVFLDSLATNLFLERKALPKELRFCSAKSTSIFISGEGIGTRFLDQTFF